jgi:hypothetical protein
MNQAQKQVIGLGTVLFAAVGVYPPWAGVSIEKTTLPGSAVQTVTTFESCSSEYRWIFDPPRGCNTLPLEELEARSKLPPELRYLRFVDTVYRLDLTRLVVQWVILLGVMTGWFVLIADSTVSARTSSAPAETGSKNTSSPE